MRRRSTSRKTRRWSQRARAGIERLNRKYAPADGTRFFLLHRPRRWNAGERAWMGYERKRGKLAAVQRAAAGRGAADFSAIVGATSVLPGIRYVITLDTDTQLPREAARQLVATMAHPLNRPVFDEGAAW
jgi:cyclic beta-1,2-glucan synthetase